MRIKMNITRGQYYVIYCKGYHIVDIIVKYITWIIFSEMDYQILLRTYDVWNVLIQDNPWTILTITGKNE